MGNSLIIDVGMHTGRDTDFYLKKGFDVVAIEANPKLVESARSKFKDALSNKNLVLYDVAIADHKGEIDFYSNDEKDDWSTISKDQAKRCESLGTHNTVMRIKCTTFEEILGQHKVPYYLKIDIEGVDLLCLEALKAADQKPRFISMEAALGSGDEVFSEIALLWNLGYRQFKVVNQALNRRIRCPNPPLEGVFVDYQFDGHSSGPFGDEAPGEWIDARKTLARLDRIRWEQKYFGAASKYYKTVFHRVYEAVTQDKVGWYDIHAKLPQS